jgi:hypothetical protein
MARLQDPKGAIEHATVIYEPDAPRFVRNIALITAHS